ncbi:MAG: fatty acid oxidation complex subunit alpha FadB [Endozoicomonadaceae bacterium]|nr:fatty acid oxidation complex subunit alpha FadB [Endozoicomonadaceae bacterium]
MIYDGQCLSVVQSKQKIVSLIFDHQVDTVNKLSRTTLNEFKSAIEAIKQLDDIQGLLIKSGKKDFIVGADIDEFIEFTQLTEEQLSDWLKQVNILFKSIEDFSFPTVSLVSGYALGGGFELCLCTDYRILDIEASVGLPEVKLGLFPGFGGTVRLPRLIGADNAIEWICLGRSYTAKEALQFGAIDAMVPLNQLEIAGLDLLARCQTGELDWKASRQKKLKPLSLMPADQMMIFETAKSFVKSKAGPHYPAPLSAVKIMQQHADLMRDEALRMEEAAFPKVAKTAVSQNLIALFLQDQALKKKTKNMIQNIPHLKQSAVIGAGIMGGGIAYQSAYHDIPIVMKDIVKTGLDQGLQEASKLLIKQIDRQKITTQRMAEILTKITATLSYDVLSSVDFVIEAVIEVESIKQQVLQELEHHLSDTSIICSNTSTLSITKLAQSLKYPARFCGMHFFNPVHRMPLVEIIRGEKTHPDTIATTVAYANKMGKTAIVVNDCPGFFVNRVLFPYLAALNPLIAEGISFESIDSIMEKMGWPMGPATLLDLIGLDTAQHVEKIMAAGFPDRMPVTFNNPLEKLLKANYLGKKNKIGFYEYHRDKKNKEIKTVNMKAIELLYGANTPKQGEADHIIQRMMIPMAMESIRCLEEKIIDNPAEADMALLYGLGFPPFKGGIFRYIDAFGLDHFVKTAQSFLSVSPMYQPTESLCQLAKQGKTYY